MLCSVLAKDGECIFLARKHVFLADAVPNSHSNSFELSDSSEVL